MPNFERAYSREVYDTEEEKLEKLKEQQRIIEGEPKPTRGILDFLAGQFEPAELSALKTQIEAAKKGLRGLKKDAEVEAREIDRIFNLFLKDFQRIYDREYTPSDLKLEIERKIPLRWGEATARTYVAHQRREELIKGFRRFLKDSVTPDEASQTAIIDAIEKEIQEELTKAPEKAA